MAKLLFAQNTYFEILSFASISATLKKHGHDVDVVIFYNLNSLNKKIRQFKPDVIGFSCITGDHNYIAYVAGEIKRLSPKTMTLVGGPHPTYFPEYINQPNIDVICIGEGEYPTLDLLNALDEKKEINHIQNLRMKSHGAQILKTGIRPLNDLNTLPFMDRELYRKYSALYNNPTKMFFFGRGCKENCSFCFTPKQKAMYKGKGKYLRQVGVGLLLEEIKQVKDRSNFKTVRMMDDSFTVNKKHLMKFLNVFQKLDLDLVASVCLNEIDEDVAYALRESRCRLVYVGIESGNEQLRNEILGKRLSNDALYSSIGMLKKHKIRILSGNIFGFPGDNIETALETIKVNIDLNVDYPTFAFFTPYPGTRLTEIAINAQLIEQKTFQEELNLFYNKLVLKLPNVKEFYNIYHLAPVIVRLPFLFPSMKYLIRLPKNIVYSLFGMFFIYLDSLRREGVNFHRLIRHPINRLFCIVVARFHI